MGIICYLFYKSEHVADNLETLSSNFEQLNQSIKNLTASVINGAELTSSTTSSSSTKIEQAVLVITSVITDFSQRLVKSLFDLSKQTIKSNEDTSKNHSSVFQNSVTDFSQILVKSIRDFSRENIKSNKEISIREELSYKQLLIMLCTKLGTIATEIQNMTLTNTKEIANSSMRIEKAIDSHRDVAESLSDKQSMLFDTSVSSLLEALENSNDKLVSSTDGISSSIKKTSSDTDMVNKENFGALITNFSTFALRTENESKMISDSLSSTKDPVAVLSSGIPEKFEEFIRLYKTPFEGNAKIHNQRYYRTKKHI